MSTFDERLERSRRHFAEIVRPVIGPGLGGGQLATVEDVQRLPFAFELDVYGGTDAWQIAPAIGIRPIASRIQWCRPPNEPAWGTFTIRGLLASGTKTEYAKRREAHANGVLSPTVTCQAYIHRDTTTLISAAVATTDDVIAACTSVNMRQNHHDLSWFYVVDFDDVISAVIYERQDNDTITVRESLAYTLATFT